jgi:SRSO17 transposase
MPVEPALGPAKGRTPWGADMKLQAGLLERELAYVVGVQPQAKIWIDGKEPLPAKPWPGRGRPPTNLRRAPDHQPVAAKEWASGLPHAAWQDVTWREGTQGGLGSRFAALRMRPAHRDYWRNAPWPELWLLVEWPEGANTGSRTCPPPHHSSGWSISPSCAGGPCAIIWS